MPSSLSPSPAGYNQWIFQPSDLLRTPSSLPVPTHSRFSDPFSSTHIHSSSDNKSLDEELRKRAAGVGIICSLAARLPRDDPTQLPDFVEKRGLKLEKGKVTLDLLHTRNAQPPPMGYGPAGQGRPSNWANMNYARNQTEIEHWLKLHKEFQGL